MTGAKEPLMHIVKRDGVSLGRAMLVRLVALVFALLVCAAIIFGPVSYTHLPAEQSRWCGHWPTHFGAITVCSVPRRTAQ